MFIVSGNGRHGAGTACVLLSVFLGSREIANEEYCNNRISKLRPQFILMQACKTPVEIQQGITFLYVLLTVHPNIMIVSFFYQLHAQIIYFNTFVTFLYLFRALLCSS